MEPEMAQEHQRLAEGLLPATAGSYYLRAVSAGTPMEMLDLLARGLDLDRRHYPSWKAQVIAHQALKDYVAMERDADSMILLRQEDPLGFTLHGIALRELGRFDEALKDQDRAERLAPDDPEVFDQRRETHSLKGDHQAALADALRASRLRPSETRYRLHVFSCAVALGNFDQAKAEYEGLIRSGALDRDQFNAWASKLAFNALFSGKSLRLPPEGAGGATFSAIAESAEYFHKLAAKAERMSPEAFRSTWSPDNTEIAYSRILDDSNGIEVLNLKLRKRRLLTVSGKDPAWSPDGRFIVFARSRAMRGLVNLNREIIPEKQENDALSMGGDRNSEELWLMTPSGDGMRRLAKGGFPSFSRRPDRVFFHSRGEGALCSIALDDDRAEPKKIMDCSSGYPVVSPDESYVAYPSESALHIVELSTGKPVSTWSVPGVGGFVTWSPDGRELSYGGYGFGMRGLWVYEIESRRGWRVFDGPITLAAWSPDRTLLAFDVRDPFSEIWVAHLDPQVPTRQSLGTLPEQTIEECILQDLGKTLVGMEEMEAASLPMATLTRHLNDLLAYLESDRIPVDPILARFPRLPPYAAIDAIIGRKQAPEPEMERKVLEKLKSASPGEVPKDRLLYLEGKLLARSGNDRQASEKFAAVIALEGDRPEPGFELARCLRAAGDPKRAEEEIRRAIEKDSPDDDRDLWDLWAVMGFHDLKLSPALLLGQFPAGRARESRGREEIRWLLERLRAGDPIRIDCGGNADLSVQGKAWGRDRFWMGGNPAKNRVEAAGGTDPVYHTERWFPAEVPAKSLYRVPLPPGKYRVTLGFAEGYFRTLGKRRFDVLLEGKEILRDFEPLRFGFATAHRESFDTLVDDGVLDIHFVPRVEDPMISTIEVQRIQ